MKAGGGGEGEKKKLKIEGRKKNMQSEILSILHQQKPPSKATIEKACGMVTPETPPEIQLLCGELAVSVDGLSESAIKCSDIFLSASVKDPAHTCRAFFIKFQAEIALSKMETTVDVCWNFFSSFFSFFKIFFRNHSNAHFKHWAI